MSSNNISLFQKYIDQIDDVYKAASKTSILDTASGLSATMNAAHEFLVPKISMDGLGDYSRSAGYAKGGVSLSFETKKPDYDRGRSFNIDAMDNEETAGIAFGKLTSEFIRTKVVPEVDAYRFAKYAASAGNKASAALSSGADVITALSTAVTTMKEAEVDESGIVLFITPTLHQAVLNLDSYKSKAVLDSFSQLVEVPSSRFYTAIDLFDGSTSGETDGGYRKHVVDASIEGDVAGKAINFLLVSRAAIMQMMKHTVNKIISPDENQDADAWKFCYRAYGIADAYDNKTAGIYLHNATE